MQPPVTKSARLGPIALALLVGAVALLAACSGGEATSPPGAPPPPPPAPPPPPPPPPDVWNAVSQRSWSMDGQTEGYKCHTELVASDEYITGFRLASPSATQTEVYLLTRPSAHQTGDYDCSINEVTGGEAIYLAGPGTTPLTFSGGKGVHVAAGQYLVLVIHINNNDSASMVTASTVIEGRVAAAKDVTTPMDMFLAGTVSFHLPADTGSVETNGGCGTVADFHLVAELPFMRALGTHSLVTITNTGLDANLFDTSIDPQHVVYSTLGSDFDVPAGSHLNVKCTYDNTTGSVVGFGESSQDELCFAGIYRYPPKPPTSVAPLDCALGNNI